MQSIQEINRLFVNYTSHLFLVCSFVCVCVWLCVCAIVWEWKSEDKLHAIDQHWERLSQKLGGEELKSYAHICMFTCTHMCTHTDTEHIRTHKVKKIIKTSFAGLSLGSYIGFYKKGIKRHTFIS